MRKIRTIPLGKEIFLFLLCAFLALRSYSQCGQDIYIANDQSGSVDSRENTQSRQFIEQLALAFPLGNANTESRIAISSWGWSNEFQQYTFPSAGVGYTTSLSDIVNYRNSPKPFSGGTDPYMALLKAYQNINLTPVAGRSVPKLIILMTDAYSYQVNPNIVSLANQVKAAGYRILVMGVDAASNNPPQPVLQAVASPGLNFTASSYDALINNAVTTIQQAIAQVCPGPPPAFDLTVAINSFDCNAGTANYSVTNAGNVSFGPATLSVSFYNGNPTTATAFLLATHTQPGMVLGAGATAAFAYTNSALTGVSNLYAVVNLNTAGSNAQPPLPFDLAPRILISGEGNTINNFSTGFTASGCNRAVLSVANTGTMGCNNLANYQVEVCNSGSAGADIQSLNMLAPSGFVLQQAQMQYLPTTCSGIQAATQRLWGTYFGGTSSDVVRDMAIDASGNIYITGETQSSSGIATAGTFDNTINGGLDGFVAKFSPNGILLWGTYFGGTGADMGKKIAVDINGDVYVAGSSSSTTGIASAGAFQIARAGTEDAILIKFNGANGTRTWGTYYGDAGAGVEDYAMVAISGNDVYLAMKTTTGSSNLTTDGTVHIGGIDILVARFNSSGSRTWATLWGGPGNEDIVDADLVASTSSLYLAGRTFSSSGIASGNYWVNSFSGSAAGLLTRFNPTNGSVHWATYVTGFNVPNKTYALTLDGSDRVLAAAEQQIFRFSENGGAPLASAIVVLAPAPTGITTDAAGNIYLIGRNLATASSITSTANAFQATASGGDGIYFAMFNSLLQKQYASYYDDVASEYAANGGIAIDQSGSLIIAGRTNTNPSTMFGTPGTHKQSNTGSYDGIIAKFEPFSLEGVLSPGCCIQLNYIYDVSAAANGIYHTSFSVSAGKASPSDGDPLILPNNNFSVAGYTGTHDGFDGAASNTDDITKTGSACVTAASPVTVAISFGGAASCRLSFGTATITINNPNTGVSLTNVRLLLNLTGTGSVFSGEPYNIINGLLLQAPNLSDPAYPTPGVTGQITGYNGNRTLTIYSLPSGIITFNVDVALGSGATNLSATVQSLPTYYNPSGSSNTATGSGYTAAAAAPTVSINCPGSINAGSNFVLSGTTTGATTIQWSSLSNNNITNTGTIAAPQASYTPSGIEIAVGYADITLRATNASGCDNGAVCRVLINNVQRDFGDAPISFDLGTTQQPLAAASTKLTGLYLGAVDPDLESIAQPTVACDGDGSDEEGLRYYPATVAGQSNLEFDIEITNNSSTQGYLVAYIDWNEDGDFLDTDEQSTTVTIPSSTGAAIYRPSFGIPFATGPITTYVRLRLSTSAEAIRMPYGASPEGEVEDHIVDITILPVELINFKAIASGKQAILNWQTATETNNDHFDIERSANGSGWQKIGTLNGYGNNSQLQTYSFTDYHPYDKLNYYRLKQVNSDGSFGYSLVRRINFESTVGITRVYPNPVKDQLYIASDRNDINYDVTITNISGQEVLRKNKASNESTITVTHLPAGVYIVKLSHQEEQPKYYKVIKQ